VHYRSRRLRQMAQQTQETKCQRRMNRAK
jgi:hypothetical protein